MASVLDLTPLQRVVGMRLTAARRIVFRHDGDVDASCGDLDLVLDDTAVVLLGGAGDGEGLTVRAERWIDPFQPPLSPEDERFVRERGEHSRVDASAAPPAFPLGDVLVQFRLVGDRFGTQAGVTLGFGTASTRFLVECDGSSVVTAQDQRFQDWGSTEGDAVSSKTA